MQHAILPVLRPQSPTICSCRPPTIHRHTPWRHLIFSGPEHVQLWLKKSPEQMVAFSQILFRGGALGKGGGYWGGGEIWGQEDKGEGGSGAFSFGKGGRLRQAGRGVLEIAHLPLACPPPSSLPQAWCQVGQGCSARWNAPVSHPLPLSPPVSPTHADHKRSQNDPKMILVSF